jgi:AcrR family transcriptional regulator
MRFIVTSDLVTRTVFLLQSHCNHYLIIGQEQCSRFLVTVRVLWQDEHMPPTAPVSNARQRVQAAVRAEIIAEARVQLAASGAAGLSLRAVARGLGMAPSAMYRYFQSRDEILTALIIEAYDAMGEVAEAAARPAEPPSGRFRSVCRSLRAWALAHPHEYALLYGAPVPGYHAPELTVAAASRVTAVLGGIVRDAWQAGAISESRIPPVAAAMAEQARPAEQALMPGVPLPVASRALVMWALLFGQVSFEAFGRLEGVVADGGVVFEFTVDTMLAMLGFASGSADC